MKRNLIALAALILGLVSCQNDFNDVTSNARGEVDFQLAINAPEITRAGDEVGNEKAGMNSAYGAIDYLQGAAENDYRVDWSDVDLRYSLEVYDKADDYAGKSPIKDRQVIIVDEYQPVKFELRLIPNRDYHFVVFADFVPQGASDEANINVQRELGLRHNIGNNLGEITIKGDAINDEAGDAYFATKDITITNSASQDITLKRPYGKLRVIATDLAELNLNVEPKFVEVNYTAAHPVAFNAVTGEIEGEQTTTNYKYEYAEISKLNLANHVYTEGYDSMTTTNADKVVRHTHMTLFTDYILAEKEGQTPYHFTMTVYDEKGGNEIKTTEFNTDIPVERNKLTTVLGNVLTTATDINVTINDNFDDEIVIGGVTSAKELQEALDNVKPGMVNEINIIDHIAGNVQIVEIPETTIIINGQGCYKYDGTMQIVGKSQYKNATTIFKNINFETKDETALVGASFIYCNEQEGNTRYPDNVTVVGCTFNGTANTVGASFRSLNGNLIFDGCKMTAGHSLMQLKSCGKANVIVKSTTINADRGIALGKTGNAAISKTNITAKSYGVRADGCTTNTTIEASTIKANLPVVVRNLTADEYTLNFTETTLTAGNEGANAEGYQVVFTKGDDEAEFVEPTGKFVANGAENYEVFPEPAVDPYTILIYNEDDLLRWAWLANHAEETYNAKFMADVTLPARVIAEDDVNKKYYFTDTTITVPDGIPSGSNWITVGNLSNKYTESVVDGNNHTLTGLTIYNTAGIICGFIGYSENIVVKDLTFDNATMYSTQQYCSPIAYVDDGSYIYNVHTTNSTIEGTGYVSGIVSMLMDHFDTKGLCDRIENDPTIQRFMPYTTMEKCTTTNTTVKGSGEFVGGICGKAYGVIIYDCHNEADVTGKNCVGGVAGYLRDYQMNEHGLIVNCSSTSSKVVGNTNYAAICGMLDHDDNHTGAITAVVGCYTDSTVANNKIVGTFNRGQEKAWGNYAEGTIVNIDTLNAEITEYNDFIKEYNTNFYSTYFEQCVYSNYKIPTSKLWTAGDLQ